MSRYGVFLVFLVLISAPAIHSQTNPEPAAPSPLTITARARSVRPGELVVLTVSARKELSDVRARAFDRDLPAFAVDARRWRVLVGIDLDVAPRTYVVEIVGIADGSELRATHRLIVTARQFRTRKLTVDPAFVNPPPDAVERINREAAELNELWSHSEATRLWNGTFVRPVPDEANSAFGTRSILNGEPRSPHSGADFNSVTGTPIKAPNGGRVVLASDRYFTGNTVMIDHGLTLFSLFAHLSEIDVKVGEIVAAGDVVGKVGATGRVTGPHLHWSVRINSARIDPLSLLSVMGAESKQP
ncbi:MAG TPA: M23 family metallopeptidase [Vicinamibacterales bacterium]|nr:M23 family metallopeptidase [Vicinamibacterales bacterium]